MLHALGISMGVERYAETITTKYANNTEAPDPLKKLTEWPSDADALWLAAHENIAICIHIQVVNAQPRYIHMIPNKPVATAHIHFGNSHYSGMVEAGTYRGSATIRSVTIFEAGSPGIIGGADMDPPQSAVDVSYREPMAMPTVSEKADIDAEVLDRLTRLKDLPVVDDAMEPGN